jgi:hypothetical protein
VLTSLAGGPVALTATTFLDAGLFHSIHWNSTSTAQSTPADLSKTADALF